MKIPERSLISDYHFKKIQFYTTCKQSDGRTVNVFKLLSLNNYDEKIKAKLEFVVTNESFDKS